MSIIGSIILGAGCFWGVEASFAKIEGVIKTQVGYSGGHVLNPTYEQVCTGTTGHAEVVEITYDSKIINCETILKLFWSLHDPTTLNRQGPDLGTQYKSVIFCTTPDQLDIAQHIQAELQNTQLYKNRKIVTEILPAEPFYAAEAYHQKYFEKHPSHACNL